MGQIYYIEHNLLDYSVSFLHRNSNQFMTLISTLRKITSYLNFQSVSRMIEY